MLTIWTGAYYVAVNRHGHLTYLFGINMDKLSFTVLLAITIKWFWLWSCSRISRQKSASPQLGLSQRFIRYSKTYFNFFSQSPNVSLKPPTPTPVKRDQNNYGAVPVPWRLPGLPALFVASPIATSFTTLNLPAGCMTHCDMRWWGAHTNTVNTVSG